MPDLNPKIETPPDPYKHKAIPPVEKKKEEDLSQKHSNASASEIIKAAFLQMGQKIIDYVTPTPKRNISKSNLTVEEIKKELKKIRMCFVELTQNDLSQESEFLAKMSLHWVGFEAQLHQLPKEHPYFSKIEKFSQTIYHYPEEKDFSLGYYLSGYAGFKWTPFPYMELLENLHMQSKQSSQSPLSTWIEMIDDILNTTF